MKEKPTSLDRVKKALEELKVPHQLQELPHSTRTAAQAAAAVKSSVGQIVKSLVFQSASGKAVLILTSGANQVDEEFVSRELGERIELADAAFVRQQTGFAIGSVSPFGLKNDLPLYIDRDLLQHPLVWAAAGSPQAVFSIQPGDLLKATTGRLIDVHP